MQKVIKNLLKQKGLFICKHPLHKRFDFEVSPYHILRQKKCFKTGCVEFIWRCKIHGKNTNCPRGYKHVGKNCFSCKYYYEEKICRKPEALVHPETLKKFLDDLSDYEYWLWMVEGKRISFSGTITAVYPSFVMIIDNDRSSVRMNGFLITFPKGYIGYDLFDDTIYLHIGRKFLARWQIAPGDELEFKAQLISDRGRVILLRPTEVEIVKDEGKPVINYSKALVGKITGAIVKDDTLNCQKCPFGALLEVKILGPRRDSYRRFYCLRGVEYSKDCPVRLEQKLISVKNKHDGA